LIYAGFIFSKNSKNFVSLLSVRLASRAGKPESSGRRSAGDPPTRPDLQFFLAMAESSG
jgi:hypothetical protein